MGIRGTALRYVLTLALAALAAAFLFGARAEKALPATTCTDSQLVPNVAELLVSQGAPGYTRLARGKETIVRAYLTTPPSTVCTLSSRQSITPISATLGVSYPSGATGSPTQLTNYQPLSGKLGTARQIYSTSDPFFVVPDSYLAPANLGSAFSISFSLRITYSRNGSTTYLTTNPTTTTSSVDQKTNALRVLVVPMGDPTSTSPQWSSTAESTLQSIMQNATRAFPVPSGVSPSLTANSTGGIRYVVSTTLLDAKSLGLYKTSGSSTKFCGSASTWSTSQVTSGAYAGHTLKADLLQRLADYNLQNAPPADLVLGVVDGSIAWKSTDGLGCDDGRAATPASKAVGQIAWVRVSTDSYPTPLQMELLHPFGISRSSISFHSPNVEADGAGPGKGYNVVQRKVVDLASGTLGVNDHSIMNYTTTSIPYTKDNTLLEPNDWADALCNLGGVDSTGGFANCTLNSALGTSLGVPAAAGRVFYQISGICSSTDVNGNCSGVRLTFPQANVPGDTETGVSCTSPNCSGPNDSPLHLLLCTGLCSTPNNVMKDVGLALLRDEGHADGGAVDFDPPNGFGAMVEMNPAWTDAALTLNGHTVFTGSASDPAPQTQSISTVTPGTLLTSFTPYFSDGEFTTSLCCNGRAIAFDGTNLYLTVSAGSGDAPERIYKATTNDGRIVSSVSAGTSIGALAFNAGHLYGGNYADTGDVYDINPSDGSKTTLFPFDDTSCTYGRYIDGLEYLSSGTLAISGDLCTNVFFKTLGGADASPQFTTTSPNSGITTDGGGGLWLALLETSQAPDGTLLVHRDAAGNIVAGDEVTIDDYEAEDLAYDSVTFAPTCAVWMNQATFGAPQVHAVAVPCGAGSGSGGQAVKVETTNARFASLFFTCGDPTNLTDDQPTFTLANGLRPDSTGQVIAAYTDKPFCGEGTPKIIDKLSNGWASTPLSDPQAVQQVTGTTSQKPITNIASPLNGAKVRRGEFVHYEGSATDAEQEAITGANLKWYDDRLSPQQIGTGQSFDLRIAANSPLGDHHITLIATDTQGHTNSTTVTISIGPALCASTAKCP
jgi:hypothetical protein